VGTGGEGTARAQPFHCPYCGEPDLRPGEQHGTWYCLTCDRRWRLAFLGLGEREGDA
jgi:ribosomal protein L37AE/L43A